MPRPAKKPSAGGEQRAEPKRRSRNGCWPCKARKIKCDETRPRCNNCIKHGQECDFGVRLNWGGRSKKDGVAGPKPSSSSSSSSHTKRQSTGGGGGREHVFSAQHISAAPNRPSTNTPTLENTTTTIDTSAIDPQLQYTQPPSYTSQPPLMPPSPSSTDQLLPTSANTRGDDFHWSPQHRAKRVKRETSPASHYTSHSISHVVNTPATPSTSDNSASPYLPHPASLQVQEQPDLCRLSVKSLLSDPTGYIDPPHFTRHETHDYHTYGYDHGQPDLDIPHNNDYHVVLPRSPHLRPPGAAVSDISTSSREIDAKQIAFEPGGYYAQPVPVKISRALEPLPAELLGNQMNLLYFHHFINHTGRVMVPHDCPENPFREVLPQMAVRNTQLLHLLLAFSASHRARLLGHDEPANRIAGWMSDVLPALRQALDEPSSPGVPNATDPSSLAPLAAAIMLASLEIVTPNTFSIRIPWQQHLQMARRLIVAKGGLHHLAQKADGARDKAIFFLSRWFAYLDVFGSLSDRHEQPLFGAYLEDGGGLWLVNRDDEEIYHIDCFFGFSGRCIALLAQVAELAASCDNQRIDPITHQVKASWRPTADVKQAAEVLKQRLYASAGMVFCGCAHTNPHSPLSPDEAQQQDNNDAAEIYATNEAFHWAGRIHLARRVLALPSSDPEVQDCVQNVLELVTQKIRPGTSAESCLLFPMFTAGCEARRDDQRAAFMERMEAVEGWGMSHVGHAMRLMQSVWDTGKSWECLVSGEFLG